MGVWVLLPQWLGTAAAFWLVWWAAQSRDATALKIVGLVLAIVPALLMPILSLMIPLYRGFSSAASIGTTFALISAAVGIARALFLAIWAIASKDAAILRIVGGVIAGLLIVFYLIATMAMATMGFMH
jgi:hypothetical protein